MGPPTHELIALLAATSFAAGLNVYATIATLGLLAHSGLLPLPAELHLLGNWCRGFTLQIFLSGHGANRMPVKLVKV